MLGFGYFRFFMLVKSYCWRFSYIKSFSLVGTNLKQILHFTLSVEGNGCWSLSLVSYCKTAKVFIYGVLKVHYKSQMLATLLWSIWQPISEEDFYLSHVGYSPYYAWWLCVRSIEWVSFLQVSNFGSLFLDLTAHCESL